MTFKNLTFLAAILLFSSCEKIENGEVNNLNDGIISIIGHGGAGFQSPYNEMPENSMASIKRAIEVYNADGVELDIQLTKDHQFVGYHDDKLETSTNASGYVYNFNLSELENVKFNRNFYTNLFLNESITSLEQILIYFSSRRIKPQLHLDLRTWLYDSKLFTEKKFIELYTRKLVELVAKYNYQPYTFIGTSSRYSLTALNQLNPELKLFLETENVTGEINYLKANSIYGVVAYNERISKSQIEFAHRNNIRVLLFNVKSRISSVEAVSKNPDFIITDNIPKLQQVLF